MCSARRALRKFQKNKIQSKNFKKEKFLFESIYLLAVLLFLYPKFSFVGLSVQGECSDYGAGLAVFDKKTLKKLYSSPKNKGYSYVSKILPLDKENQIWVFSDEGLDVYNKKFEILRRCLFYPTGTIRITQNL